MSRVSIWIMNYVALIVHLDELPFNTHTAKRLHRNLLIQSYSTTDLSCWSASDIINYAELFFSGLLTHSKSMGLLQLYLHYKNMNDRWTYYSIDRGREILTMPCQTSHVIYQNPNMSIFSFFQIILFRR